jgi:hypothetical protein
MTDNPNVQTGGRLKRQARGRLAVDVPLALSHRLDELADAVDRAGERRPPRHELVSAAILALPTDVAELSETLVRYRTAAVRDALVHPGSVDVLEFPKHKPGPRLRAVE